MSLCVYHHGRPLTKEQLAVYSGLITQELFQKMSLGRQLSTLDKALAEAGHPVTPLKAGDEVRWNSKGKADNGVIVSVDERAQKARVRSYSVHREVTVPLSTIKVEGA